MGKKRTDEEEELKGFVIWLKVSRAVGELLTKVGVTNLSPEAQQECIEIVKDNLFRMDPYTVYQEWLRACELRCSLLEARMKRIDADDLVQLKYRETADA